MTFSFYRRVGDFSMVKKMPRAAKAAPRRGRQGEAGGISLDLALSGQMEYSYTCREKETPP